jgi:hypothetical protein
MPSRFMSANHVKAKQSASAFAVATDGMTDFAAIPRKRRSLRDTIVSRRVV